MGDHQAGQFPGRRAGWRLSGALRGGEVAFQLLAEGIRVRWIAFPGQHRGPSAGPMEFLRHRRLVAGEPRTVQQQVLVQGLDNLEKLLPEQ